MVTPRRNGREVDHLLVRLLADADHHVGAERLMNDGDEDLLAVARDAGHVTPADPPRLTPAGEAVARDLVRRYRLAERLLSDVVGLGEADLGEAACGLEHVLSPGVADAICTLLGHPPVCPHGRPIPPGPCCRAAWRRVAPVVRPLAECPPGTRGRITFVGARRGAAAGIDRLAEAGLVPGAEVRLVRLRPVPVVEVGEATIALEDALAAEVFVRT